MLLRCVKNVEGPRLEEGRVPAERFQRSDRRRDVTLGEAAEGVVAVDLCC